jgi:cbb3-type cytochrome oxidase subunit 3
MIVMTDKLLVFALLIVSYLWLAFSRQARERAAAPRVQRRRNR